MIRHLLAAAVLSVALPAVPAFAQASATAARTMPSRTSLKWVGSRGPVVVLIPGLSSPAAVWDRVVPTLAADHRVLLVEVNGFATPRAPEGAAKPGLLDGVLADISAELKAARNPGKAAIVGHSLGGLLAMRMGIEHPEQVDRLMVVDALPFFGVLMDPEGTAASVEPRAAMMRDMMARNAEAMRARAGQPVTGDPQNGMSNTPEGRRKVAAWSLNADPLVVGQAMYEDVVTDLRKDIAKIAVPMTVLHQSDPASTTDEVYIRDYAAQPRAKLVPITDSAHFIMLDQPDRFAAELAAFLRR
ncbi:alpha/beta hydrolase [Sphingomonas rosea]|uniref:Alpha/beta hydrolase n=1 Tax=Sphingomonas rosea TaxID=335605 RepID=A0ABP7TVS6_9SPHN